jgi:MFS family permease
LLASVSGITTTIFTGVGGWVSDKLSERVGIILGLLIVVTGQGVFLISQTFWTFAIAWGLFGIGWGFVAPAYDALISKAVPTRLRGTAFGLFSTSIGVIALPAPYIGGLLWKYMGPRAPFLVLPTLMLLMLPVIWAKFRLPKDEAGSNQPSGVSTEPEPASD